VLAGTIGEIMILKFVTQKGTKVYGPPYSKAEEADFYRRNAEGPVTVVRGVDARKGRKSQAPRQQSPEAPQKALSIANCTFGSETTAVQS
jgi:hypothetical protein